MGSTGFRPYPRLESLAVCRCHYKRSTFFSVILRPWVLFRPAFEPATSRSADRRSPNWAYQAAVKCVLRDARHELFCVFGDFNASGTQETKGNKITEHVGQIIWNYSKNPVLNQRIGVISDFQLMSCFTIQFERNKSEELHETLSGRHRIKIPSLTQVNVD